jgi:phthiocerol/phenolphthiocerol synthesis type-I polyketide synthase E
MGEAGAMQDQRGVGATARATRWLVGRPPLSGTRHRAHLYCFPHGGGTPGEYVRWAPRLPDVQLWGVQLPGRGTRMEEAAYTRMGPLVEDLVTSVEFDQPCVFFGHSVGALVAYEAARALADANRRTPAVLVASACAPPHVRWLEVSPHTLPDAEFLATMEQRFGVTLAALRDEPELMKRAVRALRADCELLATYRGRQPAPLDCPLVVVRGLDDPPMGWELSDWRRYTTGECRLERIPGGHFAPRERPDELVRLIQEAVAASVGGDR